MRRAAIPLIGLSLIGLILAAGLFVSVSGVEGWGFSNPQARARAAEIELRAQVGAELARIQQDAARTNNEIARSSAASAVLRNTLAYFGVGVGVLILAVGSAFAVVAWINKRATSVYPNSAGLYPVIVKRSWNGVTIVHDPNRALGPTTIYTTPSLAAPLANLLGAPGPDVAGQLGAPEDLAQIAASVIGAQIEAARNQKPLVSLPPALGARIVHLHQDDRRRVDIDNTAMPPAQLPGTLPAVRMLEAGSDEANRIRMIAEEE